MGKDEARWQGLGCKGPLHHHPRHLVLRPLYPSLSFYMPLLSPKPTTRGFLGLTSIDCRADVKKVFLGGRLLV